MANLDPVFPATIQSGVMKVEGLVAMTEYIRSRPDGQYEVIIRRKRKPRSTAENSYYWGVVIQLISETTGFTPEEAHEAMKFQFLRKHFDTSTGKKLWTVRSTTDLSTVEMEEYLMQIRQFASVDLNSYIPLPNETDYK